MRKALCLQHRLVPWAMVLVLTLFAVACNERLLEPEAADEAMSATHAGVAASKAGTKKCPRSVDFVVTDEVSLLTALGAASPGDIVGVDGMIEITADVLITTEDLTLTCATSGSGLAAQPGVFDMLNAVAKGVTVDRLILDGSQTNRGPYFAGNDGLAFAGEDVRLTNNTVTCGPGDCAFTAGVRGAIISGNRFEAAGVASGVHVQGSGPFAPDGSRPRPIDGSRIERNTIIETAPLGSPVFGAIRARDGSGIVIAHNDVHGPWQNGVATYNLRDSEIAHNRIEDSVNFGVLTTTGGGGFRIEDNTFRNNRISGAGLTGEPLPYGFGAGMFLRQGACGNVFVGNNLNGNADNLGAVFDFGSGANTFVGNQNVVEDNGEFDCDGDGIPDPNIITGSGAVQHGVNLGQIVSSAVHGDLK